MAVSTSAIRRAGRPPVDRPKKLFCLPPAGGGARLYYPWLDLAPAEFDVCPVALPGREDRMTEPFATSMGVLADQMAEELAIELDRPYAVLGYSMGALLGYELILRWQASGLRLPEKFIVLAARAPSVGFTRSEPIHLLAGDAFRQTLTEAGGTPAEILENADAMALFEPILRNDFRLCETYRREQPLALPCPILSIYGTRDALISATEAAAWAAFTASTLELRTLDQPHMLSGPVFLDLLSEIALFWAT